MELTNVHIYQSTFTHESRILRITATLAETGLFHRIQIVARHEEGLAERESIGPRRNVWRVRTRWIKRYTGHWKVLATLEWTIRVLWGLRKEKIGCVNCHSLVVLLPSVLLKWLHRSRLVYDTHELETETSACTGFRKLCAKACERALIRFVDEVVTVTDSIGDWYRKEYGLGRVFVVRNVPVRALAATGRSGYLRWKLGIADDSPLFIYLGKLGPGRGVERLLRAFSRTSRQHIVFVGFGPLTIEVQQYAARFDNIHFHMAVATEEVVAIASGADVGLALLENTSVNHYLCLGNKVFEYLQCGLPVVVSDFPEMGGLVARYGCGWKIDPGRDSEIESLLAQISWSDIQEKAAHARQCRHELVWENEVPQLLTIYQQLGILARAR